LEVLAAAVGADFANPRNVFITAQSEFEAIRRLLDREFGMLVNTGEEPTASLGD
jgi:hypothetical protein